MEGTKPLLPFTGVIPKPIPLQVIRLMLLIAGIESMKLNPLIVAVPSLVVKLIAPEEPLPTIAVMVEDDNIRKEATDVPPSDMAVVPVKLVPVMVITFPVPAAVGVKLVITGNGEGINIQAAPLLLSSPGPPIIAVFPSYH